MPVLTIRLKEGSSETVLATMTVSFGPNPGEQVVLERLASLFDRQPLRGKAQLVAYTNSATAPSNADALRRLRNGASVSIDIPTESRPCTPAPPTFPPPANATYQRIVDAVRIALSEAGHRIGGRDLDPSSFTGAIQELSKSIDQQKDNLRQERLRHATEVEKLNNSVYNLGSKLEDCHSQLDDFKARNAQLSGSLDTLRREKQQLDEDLQRAKYDLSQQFSRDVVKPPEPWVEEGAV